MDIILSISNFAKEYPANPSGNSAALSNDGTSNDGFATAPAIPSADN
jgi:hypothetical protein